MSLVAYNSSDESQSSDDDTEKHTTSAHNDVTGQISDGDAATSAPIKNNKNASNANQTNTADESHNNLSAGTLLKGLPAPTSRQIPTQEDELEEVVQPKLSQMSDAPKPPQRRTRQPARISIPAVQYSSDEEEEPAAKKKKSAPGKSGLFSLLPEPVHAAKKESNRLLIPHTLSKKPPQKQTQKPDSIPPSSQDTSGLKKTTDAKATTGPAAASVGVTSSGAGKHSSQFQALTGYYTDSEEEEEEEGLSTNFFSLPSKPEQLDSVSPERIPVVTSASAEKEVSDTDTASENTVKETQPQSQVVQVHGQSETNDDLNEAEEASVTLTSVTSTNVTSMTSTDMASTSVNQDAPLDFKPSFDPNAPLSFKSPLIAPVAYGLAGPFRAKPGPAYYSMHETTLSHELPETASGSHIQDVPNPNELNQEEVAQYLEDEQFLRLQGKRGRGREEINIVDANMDDFVSSSMIELTKGLSEETQSTAHRRSKDNNPTHTQKKKHQITYLAFQAKERELELKNTWAENRLTKRQTQAKYGF